MAPSPTRPLRCTGQGGLLTTEWIFSCGGGREDAEEGSLEIPAEAVSLALPLTPGSEKGTSGVLEHARNLEQAIRWSSKLPALFFAKLLLEKNDVPR